ncbi:MAG TPA: hypothetical protein VFA99_04695 [Acidobacteriaceae bacterium]|nr:hypothetical protein [Acidobacteriaceae bacterium]
MSNVTKTDLTILIGLVAVVIGVLGKKFYYARGLYGGSPGKQAPLWAGRLMFIIVGSIFMITGFLQLFGVIPMR